MLLENNTEKKNQDKLSAVFEKKNVASLIK